ncbi:MAG: nucleoside triphosphate pyrophosphohydrolase [Weeksellaceae bacterium]|nr:nucleoside triphosphate pyrophosphohydrolase [Weeksellaceae bacterium]
MSEQHQKSLDAFQRLLNIMEDLREKCPWDRKQTIHSLRTLTIEETYELSDAILQENWEDIEGELGDLFLHLVFYAKIGEEQKQTDVAQILDRICEKLIHRHPHIYSDVEVADEEDVKKNWEKLKLKEGRKSVLEGVPQSLPAMVKAYRMQEKAKGVGFEFDTQEDVWAKVQEELQEFASETQAETREAEFGDVLFALINYARFTGINPEDALEKTNIKFKRRFQAMESLAEQQHLDFTSLSLAEQDQLWNTVKQQEK